MELSGGDKFEAALKGIADKLNQSGELRVGFLEGATYPNGTSVALVAVVNEFGAPSKGIPPRPFFRNMIAKESPHWAADIASLLKATDYDTSRTLGLMGEEIKGELQQSIHDTTEPPNSPVTNLLKQRFPTGGQTFADVLQARRDVANGATAPAGKPLEQSGDMLRAVDFEVS